MAVKIQCTLLVQIFGNSHNLVRSSKHLTPYVCATTTIPKHRTSLVSPLLWLTPSIQVFTHQLYSFPSFHKLMSCHCPRPHYELSIALNKKPELLPMIYRAPDGLPPSDHLSSDLHSGPISCAGLSFSSLNKPNSSHTSLHHALLPRMLFAQLFLWLTQFSPLHTQLTRRMSLITSIKITENSSL